MSEVRARDAAIRRELGVPPTFDLVAHVRDLSRVILPALVIALIVGGLVYMVRGSETPQYESNIVAEVQSGAQLVVTDGNLGQMVAPYVALSTDGAVLADLQNRMGGDWAATGVSGHIAVTPGTSPSLVFVKATAFSQEEADKLARVTIETLNDAQSRRNSETLDRRTKVLTDDIARLNSLLATARENDTSTYQTMPDDPAVTAELDASTAQLSQMRAASANSDRLQLLSAPSGSGLPVAPNPFAQSAVAFLVVLILVAEILVACRGRFGSRVTDSWARRSAKKFGASFLVQHSPVADMPSNIALTLSQRASLGDNVLVLVGDGVDTSSWSIPENLQSRILIQPLKSSWWSVMDSNGTAFAIIAVSAQGISRGEVTDGLRALAEVDVTRSLVLVGPAAPEPFIDAITLAKFRGKGGEAHTATSVPAVAPVRAPVVVPPLPPETSSSTLTVSDTSMYTSSVVGGQIDREVGLDREVRQGLIDAETVTIYRRRLSGGVDAMAKASTADSVGTETEAAAKSMEPDLHTDRIMLEATRLGEDKDVPPASAVSAKGRVEAGGTSSEE